MKYFILMLLVVHILGCSESKGGDDSSMESTKIMKVKVSPEIESDTLESPIIEEKLILDTILFDKLVMKLSHDSTDARWPVLSPRPLPGAILPFKRIVAYYGNFYSPKMGVLGELSPEVMKLNLLQECKLWEKVDTLYPVIPALHYLAVTAQAAAGRDAMYRLRMPDHQIEKLIDLTRSIDGIAFLDIQVGHSTVQREIPQLEKYLIEPDVHLGLDPEWSMKDGSVPGKKIGTMDASDVNFAVDYLASLVRKHKLPPKVLVVHRFTKGMLTNYKDIKTCPEVQIIIHMDGFGFPAKKVDSYKRAVASEPVQFTGFKLFYKNDTWTSPHRLMTREEILKLRPRPIYIQYQ